jgi:two-component system response regulator DesR
VVVEAAREEPEVIVLNPADSVRDLSTQISTLRKRLGDVGVVVVMKSAKPRDLRRALDAGVDGIVLEGQMQLVLPLTVRTVCAGQLSLPDEARAHVHHEVLSYRERQVLGAVAEGLTNREIAFRLKLSQSTVKRYLSTSFTKLGVRSRDEAAAAMIETDDGRQRAADSLGLALTHR